ncbi:cytidine deaminase [Falsiroseomonas sp. HW251]|uniref:cytidine deaminase n=1 Tax=Falsiroseomonas sp. HW251 TaxID=3390998 RepID=UPI003D30F288
MPMHDAALLAEADAARLLAYAPYSRFQVGAALLAEDGSVQHGCNVENASYPAGLCAERGAVAAAVSRGQRRFLAIAVAGPSGVAVTPCGICRQVLREFSPDRLLRIVTRDAAGATVARTIEDLLPDSFGPEALGPR